MAGGLAWEAVAPEENYSQEVKYERGNRPAEGYVLSRADSGGRQARWESVEACA